MNENQTGSIQVPKHFTGYLIAVLIGIGSGGAGGTVLGTGEIEKSVADMEKRLTILETKTEGTEKALEEMLKTLQETNRIMNALCSTNPECVASRFKRD